MMTLHGKKTFRMLAISMLLLAAAPYSARAAVFMETQIATGTITHLQDKVMTLDTGFTYYPARSDMKIKVGAGSTVTLRFYKDAEGKNRYLQVVAGKNRLPSVRPPERRSRGRK
jgi:hypothetical protein